MQVTDDDFIPFELLYRGLSLIEQKKQDKIDEITDFIKGCDKETENAVMNKLGKDSGGKGKKYGLCYLAQYINMHLDQ